MVFFSFECDLNHIRRKNLVEKHNEYEFHFEVVFLGFYYRNIAMKLWGQQKQIFLLLSRMLWPD
jgi:hypothetical protein